MSYTSINELEEYHLVLYPNPTTGIINIHGVENLSDDYTITITSLLGTIVEGVDVVNGQVDVTSLVKGVYFVNIVSTEGRMTMKFIKE